MPSVCAAYNCANRSDKTTGISYFRFPLKKKELLSRWVANMRRDKWQPTQYSYICSFHFEDRYMYSTNEKRRLLANAVPTIFTFPDHLQKTTIVERQPRKRPVSEESASLLNEPGERVNQNDLTDHSYCLPSPKKLKQNYEALQKRTEKLRKQAKHARQSASRRKKQIVTYKTVVAGLNKRLQDCASEVIGCDKNSDILKQLFAMQNKCSIPEYPKEIRQFALTLSFYSSKAYNYLRKFVKLPHPRTLRRWATTVNGSPGFTEESFKKLADEVQSSSGPILATLMFDEVAIKKDLIWDGNKVWGYVDLGQGCEESDDSQIAKEALVFMVTGINRSWKIPVGYCFLNGLTASVKLNLLQQYLRKLEETGVHIVGVVCDGAAANRCVMDKLGIKVGVIDSQCWFPHPSNDDKKVFCFFDAAHMLKLMRNTLCEKKELLDGDGQVIKWEYFNRLVELQEQEGLHVANKMRTHIQFESQKMKVALAAQTLSNSVADAMIFCRDLQLPEFVNCEGTVKFIKMVDTAFDLLNSCNLMNKGTKTPVFKGNKTTVCKIIEKSIQYFMKLKLCNGDLLYLSGRKMGVSGMVLDLLSLKQLAEIYVWTESPVLKFILTRRMSQDHLEQFFSSIRRSGGNRNNPNALQFRSAYRKCLITQIEPSKNSNSTGGDLETLLVPISNPVENSHGVEEFDHDYYIPEYERLTLYSERVVEYISGSVVRQVCKKVKCVGCLKVLLSAQTEGKTGLIAVKDINNSLYTAPKDVIKLLTVAERVFRNCQNLIWKKNFLLQLYVEVFRMLGDRPNLFTDFDHLMVSTEFGEESHYSFLVKMLLKQYFTCRLHHLCKTKSVEERGKHIRQMYTKLILFKGQ